MGMVAVALRFSSPVRKGGVVVVLSRYPVWVSVWEALGGQNSDGALDFDVFRLFSFFLLCGMPTLIKSACSTLTHRCV